ncbi:unnamed protein product [Mytilus coruscus]|uniref:Uncharacterized protein n=1 Tax=Mytilus coruscus TaxID=42192 RepID=A0A6J8F1C2_MYTCO|nr:unnamed protein product [Mytilus coruscus]
MSAVPENSPVPPPTVIQELGSLPVQRGEIQQQEFPVGRLKVLGGIQIGLGAALGVLSLVGVIWDAIAMENYNDCVNGRGLYSYYDSVKQKIHVGFNARMCKKERNDLLLGFDIACLICSVWKIGFMVCSIVSASVLTLPMVVVAAFGAAIRDSYEKKVVVVPPMIAVLSFVEFVVAIIAASLCCCCSSWGTSNQQSARDVILVNNPQPKMILHQKQTQLRNANVEPVMLANVQTSYPIVQNPRAHQYQVMNTN